LDLFLHAQEGFSKISGFPFGFITVLLRGDSRNPDFTDKLYQFDHLQGIDVRQSSVTEQKDPQQVVKFSVLFILTAIF